MSQPFIFGQAQIPDEAAVVYVNKEPLSPKLYSRLCANPDDAIILYDKHNDKNIKLGSIYNGFDLKTYGISTIFEQEPTLTECQNIWEQELALLKQQCIKHCAVIIIESNPNTTQPNIKHALAPLLPMNYRLDLQQKLDEFQSQINIRSDANNELMSDKLQTATKSSDESDVEHEAKNEKSNASDCGSGAGANSNEDLCETEEENGGNSLLVFSNFMTKSMKTMRQFVQIGQFIETLCLGITITKYLFLCKKTKSVLILFENESDSQLVIRKLNGMRIDNVSESLLIKYANSVLTNKVKELFHEIEHKQLEYAKEQRMKRLQRMEEEKKENDERLKRVEQLMEEEIKKEDESNKLKIETVVSNSEPFIFGQKESKTTVLEPKNVQKVDEIKSSIKEIKSPQDKPLINEIKHAQKDDDIKPMINEIKSAENKPFERKEVENIKKKKFRTCTGLDVCLLNILGVASSVNMNNEMTYDMNKDKILSYCSENVMAQYIKNMIVSREINVWQYKDYKKSQWKDVDMMLSIYLNILPLNEKVSVIKNGSELQFEFMRTSELNGVLRYFNNNRNIAREYKLNRITKSMQSAVYIPVFWEKEMMNRSMNKSYLYTIDLDVFIYFGESLINKYPSAWYKYLKPYATNGAIESIASVQNWIQFHSFHFYSNWKIAAKDGGHKMIYLWYIHNNYQADTNVLKNGFYSKQTDTEWLFYRDIESAMKANNEKHDILLCKVCIDEKQSLEMLMPNNPCCKLKNSLCGLPQLCIRFRK